MNLTLKQENTVKEIKRLCKNFYDRQDFAHDEEHAIRVTEYAKDIVKFEEADYFLVIAGSWLHQFHDHLDELEGLLDKLSIRRERKESLFHIVEVCRPHRIQESKLLEAKIVYDADALAVITSHGLIRELICNATVRKLNWGDNVRATRRVQKIFMDTLQTEVARKMAKPTIKVCELFWKDYQKWEKTA